MASRGDSNRQRIVEAADQLFYIKGFNHTSFSDIADAAGVARGNFYYYFKSKDDILEAVIARRADNIREMLAEWDEEYPDPRDRLHRYVAILTNEQHHIERYGCPMGTLCTELSKLEHDRHRDAAEMFDVFREWLEEQFRLLGHADDARELALHLLARGQGVATITNAYRDPAFLRREAVEILRWLDSL
ncbi:MAG TPA: TetR/AcrR family transcriptional regulator [Gammaproteobacteria bacterium]|nr:TetR/AcrR family transcriptional regulator [Gammaproteobacteria bacterium]